MRAAAVEPRSGGPALVRLVALLCVMSLRSVTAQGAAGAVLTGTVTDRESGAGVGGAVVLLRNTLLTARTDEMGRFRLSAVPAGRYTLKVLAIGYATDSLVGLSISEGEQAPVTVLLRSVPVGLADVVVTASRAPEGSSESGASVTMLSAQELSSRNVTTLDQALQFEPGVTFNAGQMDIRGSTGLARGVGSRVLLMLDGHPILSGDGGEIDFESLPLLDVDRVEVVKGAYSALYGSNALGGVVNLLTTPIDDRSATVIRAHYGAWQLPDRYRFTSGSLDEQGLGLQHSRRIGGIGARFFVGRELSDGYRQDDEQARWLARLKLTSPDGSAHPWDAYALWARERLGEFFTWRPDSLQPDTLNFAVDPASQNDHEIDYKLLTGATFTPIARASTLLRVSPYVNYNSVQNYFHDNGDHHRAARLGGTMDLSHRSGGSHALDVGIEVAHTLVASNFLGMQTNGGSAHQININDDAMFAQDQWRISGPWTASLGGRLDYHHATDGMAEWAASPKLGITFRPWSGLSLRTSVGHGYRSPSAIEQFVNTTQFGIQVIPNPVLRGERAWSQEIGVTATPWARLRVDGAVFQSQYHDLIGPVVLFCPAPPSPQAPSCPAGVSGFVAQFQNLTRAHVRGLDLSVKSRVIGDLLDLEATYLWLSTRDDSSGAPLPYRSRHNVTGTLSALGGLVDVDVRYRSRVEQVLQYFSDPRKHVTVVDLRVACRVAGVAFQAKVANLFQALYVDVQERNPGAPRQVTLTAFRDF
jgi:outer membrane receptor protein involved in Fe transport